MSKIGLRVSLALLLAGGALPVAAQTVGGMAAVVNEVRISTQAEPQVHQARVRERVSLGNPIRTGRASHAQILLLDQTSFQIGANAQLTIDRFVYDPNRSASAVGASVARGAFRFASGAPTRQRPGESDIRTPAASIGVRGTIVEGVVGEDAIRIARSESGVPGVDGADAGSASLIVLRGPGAGVPGEPAGAIDVTAAGRTVPVESVGYAVFVPASDQAPIGPFLLSNEGFAQLAVLLADPRASVVVSTMDPLAIDPLTTGTLDFVDY